MRKTIDYYLSLQSPWTYLGHQRLLDIATRHDAAINIFPLDFSVVFAASGGLPLAKRAPQRQAYRLVELRRWRDFLNLPLNLHPEHFPVDEKLAAAMVIAVRDADPAAACKLAGAVLRAIWAEQRNIAERQTLLDIAADCGLDGTDLLAAADSTTVTARLAEDSEAALLRGVFGAPSYIYNDELFWGQDRLDFLQRALQA